MILASLRGQTAALHDRVERAVNLPGRLHSPDAYLGLLARFYGLYAPLEARLAAVPGFGETGLQLAPRLKAQYLEEDLRTLGRPLEAVPRCDGLPAVRTAAEALGCLYVLEGATLGGQVVRKEVRRVHGFGPGTGCSFFSSYQDQVRPMWVAFCDALTRYAERNPTAEGEIVAAAVDTFTRFEEWMAW